MAREHEESQKGKEKEAGEDVDRYTERMYQFYKRGEYLDEALFDRI